MAKDDAAGLDGEAPNSTAGLSVRPILSPPSRTPDSPTSGRRRRRADRSWDSPKANSSEKKRLLPSNHPAHELTATRKINTGRFDDVTLKDVKQLVDSLDADKTGYLDLKEIRGFLTEVLKPPCTETQVKVVFAFMDNDGSGSVCTEEVYAALVSGPVKATFRRMQLADQEHQAAQLAMDLRNSVERDSFKTKVNDQVRRDDAFATLPLSLFSILVFIGLVMYHLQIRTRHDVASGVQSWLIGYGATLDGPFLMDHVADFAGMWTWLSTSGLMSVLGDCRVVPAAGEAAGGFACRLASRHKVVGDVRLRQTRPDGFEQRVWLLHSELGEKHLAINPGDFLGASLAELDRLKTSGWADAGASEVAMEFMTFCERKHMFTRSQARVELMPSGVAAPRAISTSIVINGYPEMYPIAIDVVYILQLLYPLYIEMRDIIGSIREDGLLRGCRSYINFYNAIDWAGICFGISTTLLWVFLIQAMQTESLEPILDGDHLSGLSPTIMGLDTARLESAELDLGSINRLFYVMHITMALNAGTIIMKMFKAFQANPRLAIVTDTLARCAGDIAHFSIIFLTVFIGFSALGHTHFGRDFASFSTFERSINTAFMALMGEISWYSEAMNTETGLSSGMPKLFLMTWFFCFNLFVTIVLLNMLMAIILEHYSQIMVGLKAMPNAKPLWRQARDYWKRRGETKAFVPMSRLSTVMTNDDALHPDFHITSDSLRKAIPKMHMQQAEWLLDWAGHCEAQELIAERSQARAQGEVAEKQKLLADFDDRLVAYGKFKKQLHVRAFSLLQRIEAEKLKRLPVKFGGDDGDGHMLGTLSVDDEYLTAPEADDYESGDSQAEEELIQNVQVQAEAIQAMHQVLLHLAKRLDAVGPKVQEAPVNVTSLASDIAALRRSLDLRFGPDSDAEDTPPNGGASSERDPGAMWPSGNQWQHAAIDKEEDETQPLAPHSARKMVGQAGRGKLVLGSLTSPRGDGGRLALDVDGRGAGAGRRLEQSRF